MAVFLFASYIFLSGFCSCIYVGFPVLLGVEIIRDDLKSRLNERKGKNTFKRNKPGIKGRIFYEG